MVRNAQYRLQCPEALKASKTQIASSLRRNRSTVQRWYGRRFGQVTEEQVQRWAAVSYRSARRPVIKADEEKELLARLRFAIGQGQPSTLIVAETFRSFRKILEQHGWPAWLGREVAVTIATNAGTPPKLRRAILQLLPPPATVPPEIRQDTERDTIRLTARQIAWLEAYTLLATGMVVWPRLAPTKGEMDALQKGDWTVALEQTLARVRAEWGPMAKVFGIDLAFTWPVRNRSRPQAPTTPWAVRDLVGEDIQQKLRRRIYARFNGHPRQVSLDSDAAYLLGITRQSAFYLRRSVERITGRKFRL